MTLMRPQIAWICFSGGKNVAVYRLPTHRYSKRLYLFYIFIYHSLGLINDKAFSELFNWNIYTVFGLAFDYNSKLSVMNL